MAISVKMQQKDGVELLTKNKLCRDNVKVELDTESKNALVPENIKNGVRILGVDGAYETPTEKRSVDLDLADGNQVVEASEGKSMSSLVIMKPPTLLPENIVEGVEIAGVVGEAGEEITVAVDFSEGDHIITPQDEKVIKQVTIPKPAELLPENIVKGVTIAGVEGNLDTEVPTEEKSVTLDFTDGDQLVEATDGKYMSAVTIAKPAELLPENIVEGITIAGVTGVAAQIETCTVSVGTSSSLGIYRAYYTTVGTDGKMKSQLYTTESNSVNVKSVTLNNVVCGTCVTFALPQAPSSSPNFNSYIVEAEGASLLGFYFRFSAAFNIEAGAGETATINIS